MRLLALSLISPLFVTALAEADGPAVEAIALIDAGRYDEAAALLDEADDGASGPQLLLARARLAEVNGAIDAALLLAGQAVEASNQSIRSTRSVEGANALAESHTALGRIALRAGRMEEAEEQFRTAIRLVNGAHQRLHELGVPHDETDPRLFAGPATDGLARIYASRGDDRRAERTWRSVAARTDDPSALVAFGRFHQARGDDRSASRMYDRAARLAEGKPEHARTIALHLADLGTDLDRALALAESSLEGRDDIEGLDVLAWVLHRRGDHDRAAEVIARALRTGTKDPRILSHAGMINAAIGKHDEAKTLLSEALQISPQFDPIDAPAAREALESLE